MTTKPNKARANFKLPPPLLGLVHIVIAVVLARLIPLPWVAPPFLQTLGFLLVIVGFLLGIGAAMAFRRARTTMNDQGSTARLVTFGIYRFTRNPIYLGFLFMLIGIPLNAGSYWGLLLTPFMIFMFDKFVIIPEEKYLFKRFGEEYSTYQSRVRRWV